MKSKKMIKYEKPCTIDISRVAAILGDSCSNGPTATDACNWGNDPAVIPYCPNGNQATANCFTHGGVAQQSCHTGDTPGW